MDDELDVTIDVKSVVPISEQLRSQLAHLIRTGRLADNTRLPPVRMLASDLGVAVNTVNKAYAELDREGLILSKRRAGTRVTRPAHAGPGDSGTRDTASLLAEIAHQEGLDEETVVALVREALRQSAKSNQRDDHEM